MNEENFEKFIHNKAEEDFKRGIIHLHDFSAVRRFKSVRRAIRRGSSSPYGEIYPKRPFNNRANTSIRKSTNSRTLNELKKHIYEQLAKRNKAQ